MSVRSSQSITVDFTTRNPLTGAAVNADSTPTGTLVVNGTDNAASVTVTNKTTGQYKAAVTLPTLSVGDVVQLRIAATVSSIADNEVVWTDTKDVVIDSAGLVDANMVKAGPTGSGTAQTAGDVYGLLTTVSTYVDTEVAAIKAKTDNLPASPAAVGSAMTLTSAYDFAKGTVAMTESYNADGDAPTPAQAMFVIMQRLTEFAISGTTITVNKLDGTTSAFTLTLDSATVPTSSTRAT